MEVKIENMVVQETRKTETKLKGIRERLGEEMEKRAEAGKEKSYYTSPIKGGEEEENQFEIIFETCLKRFGDTIRKLCGNYNRNCSLKRIPLLIFWAIQQTFFFLFFTKLSYQSHTFPTSLSILPFLVWSRSSIPCHFLTIIAASTCCKICSAIHEHVWLE